LTERILPSVSPITANGVINVVGTAGNDRVSVTTNNNQLTINFNGQNFNFAASQVTLINFAGGDGNDRFVNNTGVRVTASGGAGNDLLASAGGNDIFNGGSGNDILFGNGGADVLNGSSGNDRVFGGDGPDILLGGSGNDVLAGEAGNDRLFGEIGNDFLYGNGGDDHLAGGAGNDKLVGGDGTDVLLGEAGNDQIVGDPADDLLTSPTLTDPTAAVRVDQDSYTIRGSLQEAAKKDTTVSAFRDSNGNGVYDAGQDPLAASTVVTKNGTSFTLSVSLNQNANNQFFIVTSDGSHHSATVTVPLITEDSTAPTATAITRVGGEQTTASSVQFQVTFSEPVTGVDPTDFQVTQTGSVSANPTVSVSGSGASYTVTVNDVSGTGTLGLKLIDDDSIHDVLTNTAQAHPLGGTGTGNGNFTSGQTYDVNPQGSLATIVLPALNLNLLGLQVQTSEITIGLSAVPGNGKLLGNLLTTVSNLIDLQKASDALNEVLSTTVGLLNSSALGINLGSGSFDARPEATTDVLTLHVAPVHLDLLGAVVVTSPIDVSITAHSGQGMILGNIVTDLANLFNDLPGQTLNIDTLNQKLSDLLGLVNNALGSIPAAEVPTVQPAEGQILNLTVPALDLNLLGLKVETSPITVNAAAQEGDGNLLGNVLTSLLGTLDATPDKIAQLNNTLNGVLARVIGVLNAADLVVSPALVGALPPALQTLLSPVLTAPAGSSAPILDLVIASQDGTSPPVDVNLLGLNITTSDIDAHLSAVTGDGQILGNLLYNVAHLADPGGPADLLSLLNALGAGNLNSTAASGTSDTSSPAPTTSQQLLQIKLNPIDLDLLGLEVKADGSLPGDTTPDPIIVTISAEGGEGKLLGNLLGAISTLVNFPGVGSALNNVLAKTIDLVNSVDLALPPNSIVGNSSNSTNTTTPVLDVFVAPVHADLLGLVITTSPIHLTITAHTGDGLVLGNIISDLAHLFDNPPPELTINEVNNRLAQLLTTLNQQIPGIAPAPTPPVSLEEGQFLELTLAPINLNLLGLVLNTSQITVNAFAQEGNGNLLGNLLQSLLNTIDATPGNLTVLNQNLNALLAKVIGVLNAAQLSLPQSAIDALPSVLQTLLSPVLISPTPGASTQILDLVIASPDGTQPPVRADLLGLVVTTSDINAELLAQTGNGQVLGNLLYNVANLLNPGNTTSLLFLLGQLAQLAV